MTLPRRTTSLRRKAASAEITDFGTVVLSSRVRLARNIAGEHFPDWSSPQALKRVFVRASKAALAAGHDLGIELEAFRANADEDLAGCLYESHLISKDLMNRGDGAGILLPVPGQKRSDCLSIMINEEDHIRIQAFNGNYNLEATWKLADAFDSALEKYIDYAFSKKQGYLTSCPSNLGTGMRASVMLTLPGLLVCNEFDSTCRAVDRLGFNVRGLNGENTSTSSCIVQISNRGTLGFSEKNVINRLKKVVDEVIRIENQARLYAVRKAPVMLNDILGRSLSLLQYARVLQSEEAINALSAVRLGVELGLISRVTLAEIEGLSATCGYYATRKELLLSGCPREQVDDPDVRDIFRSDLVRKIISRAKLTLLPEETER